MIISNHDRFYCLPDLYEIQDSALDDIREALYPSFTSKDIQGMDSADTLATDVNGISYLPGFIGLNDLGKTDFINVVIHALAHITPLRDFFMVYNVVLCLSLSFSLSLSLPLTHSLTDTHTHCTLSITVVVMSLL